MRVFLPYLALALSPVFPEEERGVLGIVAAVLAVIPVVAVTRVTVEADRVMAVPVLGAEVATVAVPAAIFNTDCSTENRLMIWI